MNYIKDNFAQAVEFFKEEMIWKIGMTGISASVMIGCMWMNYFIVSLISFLFMLRFSYSSWLCFRIYQSFSNLKKDWDTDDERRRKDLCS